MSKPTTRKTKIKQETPRSTLFDHLAQLDHLDIHEDFPSLPKPKSTPSTPRTTSLAQEMELVRLQKEKLLLEIEVLRLKQASTTPPGTATEDQERKPGHEVKKRVIDWPQNFVAGSGVRSGTPVLVKCEDSPALASRFRRSRNRWGKRVQYNLHAHVSLATS
ncbi:hypothetical protein AC249_AIPGENE3640 [Exaiptasia diaphana]|nr:hypothetical protein AC249_AIPGENE3640 [Exaiptasia diaphana]